jgi:hypothetical protein
MKIFFTEKQEESLKVDFYNRGRKDAVKSIFCEILPIIGYVREGEDFIHDDSDDVTWEEIRFGRINQIIKKVEPILKKIKNK